MITCILMMVMNSDEEDRGDVENNNSSQFDISVPTQEVYTLFNPCYRWSTTAFHCYKTTLGIRNFGKIH